MRKLSPINQKLRGVSRQLKALKRWSNSFENYFPKDINTNCKYFNWKIPVSSGLISGNKTKQSVRVECAQRLIDACNFMIQAKPIWARDSRVVATICLPDMFTSEICIYLQDEYFQSHISATREEYYSESYERNKITKKSLAEEWKLSLSKNIKELGVESKYINSINYKENWTIETWYFGEIF